MQKPAHYEIQISSGGGQFLPVQRGEVTPNQEETIRFNKTGGSDLRILITNGSAEIAEIKLPELRKSNFVPMKENNKVLLGMSGGTDSSVAALLADGGYEVTGITFVFEKTEIQNTWTMHVDLCRTLGIPHLIYDAREMFQKNHTLFYSEYMAGRTPYPVHSATTT